MVDFFFVKSEVLSYFSIQVLLRQKPPFRTIQHSTAPTSAPAPAHHSAYHSASALFLLLHHQCRNMEHNHAVSEPKFHPTAGHNSVNQDKTSAITPPVATTTTVNYNHRWMNHRWWIQTMHRTISFLNIESESRQK